MKGGNIQTFPSCASLSSQCLSLAEPSWKPVDMGDAACGGKQSRE
jgi:hypothetical protein